MIINVKVETDAEDISDEELTDIEDAIVQTLEEWGHIGEAIARKG